MNNSTSHAVLGRFSEFSDQWKKKTLSKKIPFSSKLNIFSRDRTLFGHTVLFKAEVHDYAGSYIREAFYAKYSLQALP